MGLLYLLYRGYETHSEEQFSTTLQLLNGLLMLAIFLYCNNLIKYPLSEGSPYAWATIFYTSMGFFLVSIPVFAWEKQIYLVGITGAIGLVFFIGLVQVRGYCAKSGKLT